MDEDAFMETILHQQPSTMSATMIDGTHPSAPSHSGTAKGLEQLSISDSKNLKPSQTACEYIHRSLFDKVGAIINFISPTYHDAILGSVRINVAEPALIPAYLSKYKSQIKAHAISALDAHLREINNPAGCGENLSSEDYGISFRLATISELAVKLHPSGRREGPLYYALCPELMQPISFSVPGSAAEWTHIVNCYVHLGASTSRRNVLLQRQKETRQAREEEAKRKVAHPPGVTSSKQPRPAAPMTRVPATLTTEDVIRALVRETAALDRETGKKTSPTQSAEQAFPALPPSRQPTPVWSKDGLPDLPDA